MQREYCAEVARAEDEPMPGTADVVDVWIMLEYLPAWTAKATSDNALAASTRAWLKRISDDVVSRGLKPRLQLIRRPEIDRAGVTLMIASHDGLHRVEASDYDALTTHSLDDVLAVTPLRAHQYFVCTNGQRDVCCARFGLPTYAALRERVGERAWQTTHVGGHRFAPNVLTLPRAALYGRVQPGDVDAVRGRDRTRHARVEMAARPHAPSRRSAGGGSRARRTRLRRVGFADAAGDRRWFARCVWRARGDRSTRRAARRVDELRRRTQTGRAVDGQRYRVTKSASARLKPAGSSMLTP